MSGKPSGVSDLASNVSPPSLILASSLSGHIPEPGSKKKKKEKTALFYELTQIIVKIVS
jgi:hypothetical protein